MDSDTTTTTTTEAAAGTHGPGICMCGFFETRAMTRENQIDELAGIVSAGALAAAGLCDERLQVFAKLCVKPAGDAIERVVLQYVTDQYNATRDVFRRAIEELRALAPEHKMIAVLADVESMPPPYELEGLLQSLADARVAYAERMAQCPGKPAEPPAPEAA